MERIPVVRRQGWKRKVEDIGFTFHTIDTEVPVDASKGEAGGTQLVALPYWHEDHAYKFTAAEIDSIEEASQTLYRLCLSAVQHVLDNNLMGKLGIPHQFHEMIRKSWDRQDLDMYGRFDLAFDEAGVPKMLEFNADTPTSLYEAAVVQWFWLEDYQRAEGVTLDQFNSIQEKLECVLKDVGAKYMGGNGQKMYFACVADNTEDRVTVDYLQDIAQQVGINAAHIDIEDIGWNGEVFTDLEEKPITTIFKLYPWEWLISDEFGVNMINTPWDVIEPSWKLILSNKGILPILWELYPDHPNLLPSYWDSARLGADYVEKPLFSREGADVVIIKDGVVTNSVLNRGYGREGHIYQSYLPLKKFDGMTPILGSWIVGGQACGLGIREDANEVTGNTSRFLPHFFTPEA